MPTDIRNFFGSKGSQPASQKTPAKKEEKSKSRSSKRVVVSDDSDDDVVLTKRSPKKATPKKPVKAPSPKATDIATSEFFASGNKPKRSEPFKARSKAAAKKETTPPPTNGASKPTLNGKATPIRTKQTTSYSKTKFEDDFADLDNDDDIFAAQFKSKGKGGDDYVEISDDDEEDDYPRSRKRGQQTRLIKHPDDYTQEDADIDMKDLESEDDVIVVDEKPAKSSKKTTPASKKSTPASKKRKSPDTDDEDEDESPKKTKARKTASTPKKRAPPAKRPKKEDIPEDATIQDIFDSIPKVAAPKAPPKDPTKKFNFAAHSANQASVNTVAGSSEKPVGADNCLAGLTFVFTGILATLPREEGQALVKQYGGKVTGAASKKTSFVVLGSDAGPAKLRTIEENKIKTINEEGLFELIRRLPANGGSGKNAAEYDAKKKKEVDAIKKMAEEMDAAEKERAAEKKAEAAQKAKAQGASTSSAKSSVPPPAIQDPNNQLWTVKYAPTSMSQICGNKGQVEKLQKWLHDFQKNQRHHFKMAGPNATGVYRAIILSGPPGIGKTTAAHLVAKLEGYDIVESNASDTRSKKMVEEGLKGVLSTTSLMGYFSAAHKQVEASKKKLVLIMDEVDGMSAGDRGGVGALAALCKKTEIPMILICNDRKLPKMKPFDFVAFDLPFRRPTVEMIRGRISTIAFREKLQMPTQVINALIEGTHSDIRQVVNMLSTAKLDQSNMDFDQSKKMSKAWEKHVILKPWDITTKILGGSMFAESSKATLNEKIELYFNDFEFSSLMLQENYLGTTPMRAGSSYNPREKNLDILKLVEQAASSISDGDLVDRQIHGSQQQWSLMPTHAVFSFVRPASFVSGTLVGHQTRFTSWLGQNSKQGKLTRMVKEIQGHMRLRSSGDRHEIRQQYVPTLWSRLNKRLSTEGKDGVPDIIDLMDSYFLTKDDFDAISELGIGYMDMEKLKIETQAKATFTRQYNQMSHPLPFMKASSVVVPKKAAKERPDLEEAIEESDDGEQDVNEAPDNEEDGDMSKDKYIKAPKKKKAAAAPQKSGGKKRVKGDSGSEEEAKPAKKGKGKAKK